MIIGNIKPIDIDTSPTILAYKERMTNIMRYYDPHISPEELSAVLDYSISKRYKEYICTIDNNYTKTKKNKTLLAMADYIASREPIVTSMGTMFKKHADCPNPLGVVIQQFLDQRKAHKKMMFKFPKGSEDFEKYNLLQSLTEKVQGPRLVTV